MDGVPVWTLAGLGFGVALGFAGAFGGFVAFVIVLVLGVVGFFGGRVAEGGLDVRELFGSSRRAS